MRRLVVLELIVLLTVSVMHTPSGYTQKKPLSAAEKQKVLDELQKKFKFDNELLEENPHPNMHCIARYTEHSGCNVTAGSYTLTLRLNNDVLGTLTISGLTKPDTPGTVTQE